MPQCRITVLKRLYHKGLLDQFCSLDLPPNCDGCPRFKEGDTYSVNSHHAMPEHFCPWAWADIQRDVMTALFGGNFPWIKQEGTNITCCTDGLMPVIFKVERIID